VPNAARPSFSASFSASFRQRRVAHDGAAINSARPSCSIRDSWESVVGSVGVGTVHTSDGACKYGPTRTCDDWWDVLAGDFAPATVVVPEVGCCLVLGFCVRPLSKGGSQTVR
jgi:hypothetical protein